MTTIYLIRHSVRMKKNLIEEYKTNQSDLLKVEKIVLSPLGEERAKLLSSKSILIILIKYIQVIVLER